MQVSELRKLLLSFATTLKEAQASKATVSEIEKLIEGLGPVDELSITQLVKLLEKRDGTSKKAGAAKQVDEDVVSRYGDMLTKSRNDPSRFDIVFSELQTDKQVRLPEIDAIARQFVGGTRAYKKKADALKDIRLRFDAGLAAQRRREASSGIF